MKGFNFCALLALAASLVGCGEPALKKPAGSASDVKTAAQNTAAPKAVAVENDKKVSRLKVATTIDFLDYVFYYKKDKSDYFTLEAYEKILKQMAEGGIKKIYLRVNANGLTLYPTKLSKVYGTDYDCHFFDEVGANKLINTLKKYDPLKETVRLGHKYGMEVWAWESLMDDSGPEYFYIKGDRTAGYFKSDKARHMHYTLLDPFFRQNPDGYVRLDPRLDISDADFAAIEKQSKAYPIKKIVIQNQVSNRPPVRLVKDDIEILTSDDNATYTVYDGDFSYSCGTNEKNQNYLVIDGLNLKANFVKLQLKRSFPGPDKKSGYTIGLNAARDLCKVYNVKDELITTVWATILDSKNNKDVPFSFKSFLPAAFDSFWNKRQVGFAVGEIPKDRYFTGVAEFTVPKTMDYRVARFKELTSYGFDGFMFNLRTHSFNAQPAHYGFNPEVREMYKQKYGVDIWTQDYDKAKLHAIRFQSVADFFLKCRSLTSGRPLYVSAIRNGDAYYGLGQVLTWDWNKLVETNAVDGINLMGTDDYQNVGLTAENAKKVKLGVFREMGFPPKGYNFAKDIAQLKKEQKYDEVELYESLVLTEWPPNFNIIKE